MFSIHVRQLLSGLCLPILILLAVGLLLLGQVWPKKVSAVRLAAAEQLVPVYRALVFPQKEISSWIGDLHGIFDLTRENARLRTENSALRHWYDTASLLAAENARLKASLHWAPEAAPHYISGRVVHDDYGPYARAVLLNVGREHHLRMGGVALDENGLLGRVSEVGEHVVRILLITDGASRIPVVLASSGGEAILAGDDTSMPRLIYYTQDHPPVEGEKVETRGQSNLPGGLPVGSVHYLSPGRIVVVPQADLTHLDIVRIFDYGVDPQSVPAALGRVKEKKRPDPAPSAFPFLPGLRGMTNFFQVIKSGKG